MINFSGLVTREIKDLHKALINALLEDGAFTLPCRFIYTGSEVSLCPNCLYDSISKRSAGAYRSGGPIPFDLGEVCPYCHGVGAISTQQEEIIHLAVIWDYKKWVNFDYTARSPEGYVQTMSKIETLGPIKRATEVIIDTTLEPHVVNRFIRDGEPEPGGLGSSDFLFTMWKKV